MNNSDSSQPRYQEQRDFHRMAINAPATIIYTKHNEMLREQAICKDLSATGVSLHVSEALQTDDDIEVLIKGKNVQPLDIKAKVLRVSEAEEGGYIIGCAITSMR